MGEVGWASEAEGVAARGRGTAKGGRQGGPSAATYPNFLAPGKKGRGRLGQNLGTDQELRWNQAARGSMEGRGGEWRAAGRGGSLRPRTISRSPPSKMPPAKRVDTKNSPLSARKGSSISQPGPGSKNIYRGAAHGGRRVEGVGGRRGVGRLAGAGRPILYKKNYKLVYYNAFSIVSKIDELRAECPILQADIIMTCESFCREDITDAFLTLAGYQLCSRRDGRDTDGGRWLLIYVKDGISAAELQLTGAD